MIKIAHQGKWGYFDLIICNANKTAFESFFAFFKLHYYIMSYHTQALDIARLDISTRIYHKQKIRKKSARRLSLFWLSYLDHHLRP